MYWRVLKPTLSRFHNGRVWSYATADILGRWAWVIATRRHATTCWRTGSPTAKLLTLRWVRTPAGQASASLPTNSWYEHVAVSKLTAIKRIYTPCNETRLIQLVTTTISHWFDLIWRRPTTTWCRTAVKWASNQSRLVVVTTALVHRLWLAVL